MILLPKGQAVFEQLNTSFAQLDAMLTELNSNRFTGYVQVIAWDYEGVLLLDTGNLLNAVEERSGQRCTGPIAAAAIAVKAREKDGTINVYRLTDETVELLAGSLKSELMFKDLGGDFTSLDKLVAKLGQEKHTGHVEIRQGDSKPHAMLFLRDGQVIESLLSRNGAVSAGTEALEEIMTASHAQALFSVYRADLAQALASGNDMVGSLALFDVIELWQQVMRRLEVQVDQTLKSGTFLSALKREFVDHATRFPFLDPFAAEFQYRDGKIRFEGEAPVARLNQGLCQCISQALRRVSSENRNKNIWRALRPCFQELVTQHGQRLDQIGLVAALPEAFQQTGD